MKEENGWKIEMKRKTTDRRNKKYNVQKAMRQTERKEGQII